MKLTDRTRPILSTEQTRWFMPSDSRWLEEFQQGLKDVLKEIERCFNELLGENRTLKEQIKLVDDFIQQIKNIEAICSHIRSPMLFDQIMELKKFKIHLQKHEESVTISEDFIRLFWNILRTIGTYIQNYCQAFLIPYGVEFSNQVDQPIDIEQLMDAVMNSIHFLSIKILLFLFRRSFVSRIPVQLSMLSRNSLLESIVFSPYLDILKPFVSSLEFVMEMKLKAKQ